MKLSKLLRLRKIIETAAEFLEDGEALEAAELFPEWDGEAVYRIGQRVRYQGILYRCLQGHQAQDGWNPGDAPSLWARVLIEENNTLPEWIQPGSTNPYQKGDRVRFGGRIWESLIDNNIWVPGVYGWEEIS